MKQVKDEGNSSKMKQLRLEDMEIKRGLSVESAKLGWSYMLSSPSTWQG